MDPLNFFLLFTGIVLVETLQVGRQDLHGEPCRYVMPAAPQYFESDADFSSGDRVMVAQFISLEDSTLSVSCNVTLLCAGGAYVFIVGNSNRLLGLNCTNDTAVLLPVTRSDQYVAIIVFSGHSQGNHFNCEVSSVSSPGGSVGFRKPPSTALVTAPSNSRATECQCGSPSGTGADSRGGFPWQVAFGHEVGSGHFSLLCGGSLISPDYVLTAAHCMDPSDPDATVFLGSTKLDSHGAQLVRWAKIMVYEKQNILLVKLLVPAPLSPDIYPICLPRRFVGTTLKVKGLLVTGWRDGESELRNGTVRVSDKAKCNESAAEILCTSLDPGVPCIGNPGSSLIHIESGVTYLLGILTSHTACDAATDKQVFMLVMNTIKWIDSKTGTPLCSR